MDFSELGKTIALLYDALYTPAPPHPKLWEEHLMIREVIDKITTAQLRAAGLKEPPQPKTRTPEQLSEFLKWCDEQKIQHSAVEVVPCANHDGYGLRAARETIKEAEIVAVPRSAMIDIELIQRITYMERLLKEDPLIKNNQNMAVALFLCSEKVAPSSPYSHYVEFLPSRNPVPLFYTVEEFQKLRPSPCFEEALIFFRSIIRQYSHFLLEVIKKTQYQMTIPEEKEKLYKPTFLDTPFTVMNFTWELFSWGVSTVTCRCNSVPSSKETDAAGNPLMIISMIPFLDLANHNSKREASCNVAYNVSTKHAVLTTSSGYRPGDDVEMFYGKRSSGDYLIHNGFVPSGGIFPDFFELRLNFPKSDPLGPVKMIKLETVERQKQWESSHSKKYMVKTYAFQISNSESPIPENLKLFVKLFITNDVDDEQLQRKELEKEAAEWLKNRLQLILMGYKPMKYETPIEKNFERLHSYEKEILKHALKSCTEWHERMDREITMLEELKKRYKKKEKRGNKLKK